MISKSDLRKQLLEKRKKLNIEMLSKLICENIKKTDEYKNAKKIFAYYPMKYEVDITSLFSDIEKTWFLPKVFENDMKFFEYKKGDMLRKSNFGVYEPEEISMQEKKPDLIIVPAISVDKRNYRLGYGKGFYDRFLSTYEIVPFTIVPVFSAMIENELPIEIHDKKIDMIITEEM